MSMCYALIRDAEGKPCVDDLKAMPLVVWETCLSQEDKEYLVQIHGIENVPFGGKV